jgi:hypothetical protein
LLYSAAGDSNSSSHGGAVPIPEFKNVGFAHAANGTAC